MIAYFSPTIVIKFVLLLSVPTLLFALSACSGQTGTASTGDASNNSYDVVASPEINGKNYHLALFDDGTTAVYDASGDLSGDDSLARRVVESYAWDRALEENQKDLSTLTGLAIGDTSSSTFLNELNAFFGLGIQIYADFALNFYEIDDAEFESRINVLLESFGIDSTLIQTRISDIATFSSDWSVSYNRVSLAIKALEKSDRTAAEVDALSNLDADLEKLIALAKSGRDSFTAFAEIVPLIRMFLDSADMVTGLAEYLEANTFLNITPQEGILQFANQLEDGKNRLDSAEAILTPVVASGEPLREIVSTKNGYYDTYVTPLSASPPQSKIDTP